jgi:hypothetical protein
MRLGVRAVVSMAVASAGSGASLVACFDLFHSTSGIVSQCQLDAQACDDGAAQVDAATDGGTDFSLFTPDEAVAHAQHACAWLGACQTPLGSNAFGACMFDALLAYDVGANPNHPVRGETHALWDCLWQVQSCGDVARCVFPSGLAVCQTTTDLTTCGKANGDVVIECRDGGLAVGDNCAQTGQTCATTDAGPVCGGGSVGANGCKEECDGAHLHWCGASGVDVGLDCASNGAGQCAGFPGGGAVDWIACVASSDAGACDASATAQCSNGYAISCPSGVVEAVYCPTLLQLLDPSVTSCVTGNLSPPFDWTSPCVVPEGGCTADSCDGDGGVVGCARGAAYAVDCASQGLGPCTMVATNVGAAMNAACTAP